jgi:hypothetical protein
VKNALAVARKPSSEPTWISVTDPPPWLPKEALPRGGQPAVTAEVTPPTEPAWEPDLVPMEGPPEGPFAR